MTEATTEAITEHLLLKEEAITRLDQTVTDFQDEKINSLQMFAQVLNTWNKAYANPELKKLIDQEFRKRRQAMQQFGSLDIGRRGDPIRKRYSPQYWLGEIPEELKNKQEVFILDRIKTLRSLFASL